MSLDLRKPSRAAGRQDHRVNSATTVTEARFAASAVSFSTERNGSSSPGAATAKDGGDSQQTCQYYRHVPTTSSTIDCSICQAELEKRVDLDT